MSGAPNTTEYLAASEEAYSGTPVAGLTPLLNADGTPVVGEVDADGFYAAAYVDASGNVIIAYRGTVFDSSAFGIGSVAADSAIFAQTDPTAFSLAANFFNTVQARVDQIAQQDALEPAPIYLTGHSLGGAEAEYVAELFSFNYGGAAFGAPGIPGYTNTAKPTNFVSYVKYGDPVANFASDVTGEAGFAPSNGMDHVGQVQVIGNPSDGANLAIASIAFNKVLPGSILDPLPTSLKVGLWPVDLPYVLIGLAGNLDNHALSGYASNLNLVVPGLTLYRAYKSLTGLLAGLEAPLGVAGQQDLSQAVYSIDSSSVQTPLFGISISADGNIITVDQKKNIQNSSGSTSSDAGTLVFDVTPNSSGTQSAFFTDTDTNSQENLVVSSSNGVVETASTNNGNGTSSLTDFDYTDTLNPFYVTEDFSESNETGQLTEKSVTNDNNSSEITNYTSSGSSDSVFYNGADGTGNTTGSNIFVASGDRFDATIYTSNEDVTFGEIATLQFAEPSSLASVNFFNGVTLTNFAPGDFIDFEGLSPGTLISGSSDNVTAFLSEGFADLNLAGQDYTYDVFSEAPDGSGGTLINVNPGKTITLSGSYYNPRAASTTYNPFQLSFTFDPFNADANTVPNFGTYTTQEVQLAQASFTAGATVSGTIYRSSLALSPTLTGTHISFSTVNMGVSIFIPNALYAYAYDYNLASPPDSDIIYLPEITPENLASIITSTPVVTFLSLDPSELLLIDSSTINYVNLTSATEGPACYRRGTHILTPAGEVVIEDLKIGDLVVTRMGEARPLIWIGGRSYSGTFLARNRSVWPICIRAGAFADGVPARDLYVSPLHAFYFDGRLIPADALVNGATIDRVAAVSNLDYFHLELATHDVIFAEGAAAETYIDLDNRNMFQNASEYGILYPDNVSRRRGEYAERCEGGAEVAAARMRFADRAEALGYLLPRHLPIELDGVGPVSADIPAGVSVLDLLSPTGRAAGDRRLLGALITEIQVNDVPLDLADAQLSRGFYPLEWHDRRPVRWTDGHAVITICAAAQTRRVTLQVASVMGARLMATG